MEEHHHISSSGRDQKHQQRTSSSTPISSYVWKYYQHPTSDRNNQSGNAQEVKHTTQYASHQYHRVADSTTTPLMGTLLPPRGWPGMRILVYLPFSFLQNGQHLQLAFNCRLVDTQLTYTGDVVAVIAYVPHLEYIQAQNNTAHVTLCLIDGRDVSNHWDLGEFVYEQQPRFMSEPWSTPYGNSSIVSQQGSSVSHSCNNNNNNSSSSDASTSAIVHGTQTSNGGSYYYTPSSSGISPFHATYYYGKGSSNNSILSFRPQNFRVEPHQVVSPTEVLHQHPRQTKTRSKRRPEMTISTISPKNAATIIPPVVPYEFYLSLPLTVGFEILNNFEDILVNWSEKESKASRRIVCFWRVNNVADIKQQQKQRMQDSNHAMVYCKCTPVNIQHPLITNEDADNTEKGALVSCIEWEGEHYVTSVDVIKILQEMLNKSFTVQSKNRIRRNLEGFKPITAGKHKAETAGLFKLIMGLNHPRPRNIEKDIKVFYWRTLPSALKKVIDKYFTESLSTRISRKRASNNDPPLTRTRISFPTTSRSTTIISSTRQQHHEPTSLDDDDDDNKNTKSKRTLE